MKTTEHSRTLAGATGSAPIMDRLQNHLCMMAPHRRDREAGRLMTEAVQRLSELTATLSMLVTDSTACDYAMTEEAKRLASARLIRTRNKARQLLQPNTAVSQPGPKP
jgi:hypothetical protein